MQMFLDLMAYGARVLQSFQFQFWEDLIITVYASNFIS